MVTTDCGREAMQRRERSQENVPRELGRGILTVTVRWAVGSELREKEMLLCYVKAGPHPITEDGIPDREIEPAFPYHNIIESGGDDIAWPADNTASTSEP